MMSEPPPDPRLPRTGMKVIRLLATVSRWIGWWIATGLIVLSIAIAIGKRPLTAAWLLGKAAPFAVPGLLFACLLWRKRRDRDRALVAAVLSVGFWGALFWFVLWNGAAATPPELRFAIQRRESADHYEAVDCGATNQSTFAVDIPLNSGEEIIAAQPSITSSTNLREQSVTQVGIAGDRVLVHYKIVGLNRDGLHNCPGGGNAHMNVTATVKVPQK